MKMKLVLLLILFGLPGYASESIWPELSASLGSSKIVGEVGNQAVGSYDLGILIWGAPLVDVNARTGFFSFEFGGFRFNNKGNQFIGSGESVSVNTTTLMPYVRLAGDEASSYFLLGVGIRLSTLMSDGNQGLSDQTFGSYVFALQYLYRLNESYRIGAKVNWSGIDQILNDQTSFIEVTQAHLVLTYQP